MHTHLQTDQSAASPCLETCSGCVVTYHASKGPLTTEYVGDEKPGKGEGRGSMGQG